VEDELVRSKKLGVDTGGALGRKAESRTFKTEGCRAGLSEYDAAIMGQIDEQKERQRLAELYASLEEGELREIAADADSLTELARGVLRSEMLSRGMAAPPAEKEASETSSKKDEMPGPIMVGQYRDSSEAMIAKSMLDSAGIESFLSDENLVRLDWFYSNLVGGIKLMVREEDAETATKLLEEQIPEKFDVAGVGEYVQPRCPHCGSLDVSFDELNKQIAYPGLFLGVPIPVNRKGGRCHACGHKWGSESEPSSV
jgi:hypothetical protein